jgi:hypothetical protein
MEGGKLKCREIVIMLSIYTGLYNNLGLQNYSKEEEKKV